MQKIPVYVYSTYLTIHADARGYIGVGGGHIRYAINGYRIIHYNKTGIKIGEDNYFIFDESTHTYRFPRGALFQLEKCFEKMREFHIDVEMEVIEMDPIPPRTIDVTMRPEWKDRPEDIPALQHFATKKPMLACELQTGKGKTYVATKAAVIKSEAFFVLCNGLVEQWVHNLLEKTTLRKNDIFVVQTGQSLVDLIQLLTTDRAPAVVVASIPTIRNYIKRDSLPYTEIMPFEEMLRLLRPGTIIHDEFHLDFRAHVIIDLYSNAASNYYLSATARRTDTQEKYVYNKIYPKKIFGGKNDYDKYVDITLIKYTLDTCKGDRTFTSYYGYSHNKYESLLLKSPGLLSQYLVRIERIIGPAYFHKYEPGDTRCIIYAATKPMCIAFRDYFRIKYPGFDIRTYITEDKIDNLTADVIIGTPSGLGVGKDIPRLSTVLNTVSMAADTRLEQMVGRIRKVPGISYAYLDMYNGLIGHQCRHADAKRRLYSKLAKNFTTITL